MKHNNDVKSSQRSLLADLANSVGTELKELSMLTSHIDRIPYEERTLIYELGVALDCISEIVRVPFSHQLVKVRRSISCAHKTLSEYHRHYDIPPPDNAIAELPMWGLAGTCPHFMQTALRGVYPFAHASADSGVAYSFGLMYAATAGNAGWLPNKIVEFLDSEEFKKAAKKVPMLNGAQRWDID